MPDVWFVKGLDRVDGERDAGASAVREGEWRAGLSLVGGPVITRAIV